MITPDLYELDILAWSAAQADRLRRHAVGERVNDVDWPRVIEEVEGVGRSELRAARSLLLAAAEHALKLRAMPDHPSARHWWAELLGLLDDAADAYQPSMAARIDAPALWRRARGRVLLAHPDAPEEALPADPPAADAQGLLAALRAQP